jgi:dihydrodipicolinate synthase/N-acetylneuraminate lyase
MNDHHDALAGVHVAAVTPFRDDRDRSVDLDAYLAHLAWLAQAGVDGVVCFGTNGEGPSMGASEKSDTIQQVVAADLGVAIIPTVSEGTLPGTVAQLERLNELSVAAVMVLPPYYFEPAHAEGLRAFYEHVVPVSRHPFIIYHIPKYAVGVPPQVVVDLPVWGVQDSGGEPGYAEHVLAGDRGVLLGTEAAIRAGLAKGAQGLISALANVVPEQLVALYDAVRSGDDAAASGIEERLLELRARTKEYASPGVLKRLAEFRHGYPMGTVRPPLVPVPSDYDAADALSVTGVSS